MTVAIVVDSGTTNTRVRLWDGARVAAVESEQVGARNTAMDGHNRQVRQALKRMIGKVITQTGATPEAVLCSGMITSNVGLLEVPHLPAPAELMSFADGAVRLDFPDVSALPFYFIPGVKSLPAELSAETLGKADILRGEEAESIGLRELLDIRCPVLFMLYGSHHKAIAVDADGRILNSRTSMTGELLAVIMQNTVLKSSVIDLNDLSPDPTMWNLGLHEAASGGFGRALFLTRVAEQIWKRTKAEATSYLLGVLTSLDLPLLAGARASGACVVLCGKGHFPPILKGYLDQEGWPDVRLVDEATAELSSVVGAIRIYEAMGLRR